MAEHAERPRTVAGRDRFRTHHPIDFAIPHPTHPNTGDAEESRMRREEGDSQRKSPRKVQREGKTTRQINDQSSCLGAGPNIEKVDAIRQSNRDRRTPQLRRSTRRWSDLDKEPEPRHYYAIREPMLDNARKDGTLLIHLFIERQPRHCIKINE